jgi:hypothetical protein
MDINGNLFYCGKFYLTFDEAKMKMSAATTREKGREMFRNFHFFGASVDDLYKLVKEKK